MRRERLVGVGLTALSAVSFGALGVLARVAYDDGAEPISVLMVRFGLAGTVFVGVQLVRRAPGTRPAGRTLAGLVVMGACYFLQSFLYFSAVDHAPPGLVALLLYTFPALVVVLSVVLLRMRLDPRVGWACVVALLGTALIIGPSASGGDAVGIAFGLGAALVYAGYILLGSQILGRTDALWASTVIMVTAAACFAAVYLVRSPRPSFPTSGSGWSAIVAIALLCTVVAGLAFLAGLARVGPADASTISTLEPVVSVILSAIVVGEAITGWTVAGGLLVGGSVIVISRIDTDVPMAEPVPQG